MQVSTTESTDAFTLRWSFAYDLPAGRASLHYALTAHEELYVSDRLWDYDRVGRRIADRWGVYRFVHGTTLRLAFVQAPRPPNISVHVVFAPLWSRVQARETHTRDVPLTLPIDEYSALARDVSAPHVLDHVTHVSLIFDWCRRRDLPRAPLPPPRESGEAVGFMVYDGTRYVSTLALRGLLPVHRRTGPMPRLTLPGDR